MNAVTTTTQNHSVKDVQAIAGAIATSGLFGIKTFDQAFALCLIAQAEGRHPATVAQEYDIIQGRPALKAQAALARFQFAGGAILWGERSDSAVEATFTHQMGGSLTVRWDMERAKNAQLLGKDNWKKFPAQMLSARVISEGVRAVLPACLNGCYLVEEAQDFEPPRHTPALSCPPAKMEVTQTPAIELADPVERDALLAELKAHGVTREGIGMVIGGAKLKDINVRHIWALEELLTSIKAVIDDNTATDAEAPE